MLCRSRSAARQVRLRWSSCWRGGAPHRRPNRMHMFDATGFFIGAVSRREELHSRNFQSTDNHMRGEEARRIAKAISRLPDLLKRPQASVFLQKNAVSSLAVRLTFSLTLKIQPGI